MPINAVDSITLAVEHTKQQLFKPFRIGQWTRLALVGMLAGELGGNGCSGSNFHVPQHTSASAHRGFPSFPGVDPGMLAALAGFLVAAVVAGLAIGIILMYVGSVMRFVLFDSIIARECHIRWDWSRRLGPGWQYFVWKLLYLFVTLAGLAVLVGLPLAFAFARGWLREPREHLLVLITGGVVLAFILLMFSALTAAVLVLTKDFVIPQMALENVSVMEGWRRLWAMMQAEAGAYVVYVVMKIVLAVVVGILIGIAALILGLFFAIPTVGLGIVAVLTGKTVGLAWNAYTITLAIVVGCILLAVFFYLVSLISVPAIVFFPAYSVHFFAGRYPRLNAVLYPAPASSTG